MGLISYFFKCDPFELNFRLLVLNGFWPLETKNKLLQIFYAIYSYLCFFSPISMFFIQILDLYLLRNDLFTFTKNMCSTSVTFAAVVKGVLIFYKIEHVQKLHKKLEAFKKSRVSLEDVNTLQKAKEQMAQTTKTVYSLAVPCVTAWMLYPGLESSKQKAVPFPYRLPTDDWSSPIYEILYTYQSLSMIGFMVLVLSNDLIYYGLVIQINAAYDMLIKRFEILGAAVDSHSNNNQLQEAVMEKLYDPVITEKVKMAVKEYSIFHQDILKEINQLKIIYGRPYFVHFLAAVALVGSIIMDIIVVSKGFKLQLLQRVMYSVNGIFDTFLCCFFTTQMEEKSYELRRAVYSSPWYRTNSRIRKDLMMILMRSIRAPAVRVANYFPLNLATFLNFLKMSYNITALMYQTIKK